MPEVGLNHCLKFSISWCVSIARSFKACGAWANLPPLNEMMSRSEKRFLHILAQVVLEIIN